MKVLFVSSYYMDRYVRQSVVRQSLQDAGLEVRACVVNGKGWLRIVRVMWKFLMTSRKDVDCIVLGFRGFELLPFIRMISRRPIVFDAFISPYDSLVNDRKTVKAGGLLARTIFSVEKWIYSKSDVVLFDTAQHAQYVEKLFSLPTGKCAFVSVGYDSELFTIPQNSKLPGTRSKTTVLYYGTGLQLHGIETVLDAAMLLNHRSDIVFDIIGPWQKYVQPGMMKNVAITPWVQYEQLPQRIAQADICLGGHFSSSQKAARVVPGKAFQFFAMQRAVVLGDNTANRSLFTDEHCEYVAVNDPHALAKAIEKLADSTTLQQAYATTGYSRVHEIQGGIAEKLRSILKRYDTA